MESQNTHLVFCFSKSQDSAVQQRHSTGNASLSAGQPNLVACGTMPARTARVPEQQLLVWERQHLHTEAVWVLRSIHGAVPICLPPQDCGTESRWLAAHPCPQWLWKIPLPGQHPKTKAVRRKKKSHISLSESKQLLDLHSCSIRFVAWPQGS